MCLCWCDVFIDFIDAEHAEALALAQTKARMEQEAAEASRDEMLMKRLHTEHAAEVESLSSSLAVL